jgi:hypothetical protein
MAFESSVGGQAVEGNLRITYGTYTNGSGDTGGDIDTGLPVCDFIMLQPGGSSAIATASVVNETLPVAGSAVTVVTADNEDGTWFAFGH